MSAISPHHQDEIAKFLKFFRSRLKNHLENVEADFEDTRSDRLSSDDVYSQKDVQSALSSLCFAVQANVRSELQDSINMMALLLRQIFVEAENSKLALELDIGQVEDKELLEKVEKLSVAEWADEETTAATKSKQFGNKKTNASVSPAKLLQQQMQKQHDEELRQAKRTQEQQQEDHTRELKATQRKLFEAQDKIDELSFKLEDMQKHISQTKQFQSMKTMVAQKNTQLQELRRRLKRYEPDDDDADAQDDDDEDDDGGKRND